MPSRESLGSHSQPLAHWKLRNSRLSTNSFLAAGLGVIGGRVRRLSTVTMRLGALYLGGRLVLKISRLSWPFCLNTDLLSKIQNSKSQQQETCYNCRHAVFQPIIAKYARVTMKIGAAKHTEMALEHTTYADCCLAIAPVHANQT